MTLERRNLGIAGEDAAARWYEAHGFEVVVRNWRCQEGELDLVARRGALVVFCEVKTRTTSRFGVPSEAVTPAKQRRIRRLAARWLREWSTPGRATHVRFDVAAVLDGEVELIAGAF